MPNTCIHVAFMHLLILNFTLTVDGTNTVGISMNGQNGDETRYRENYANIRIDRAYQCRACGLCRDFKLPMTGADVEFIEKCDGDVIPYRAGLSVTDTSEAYDIHRWSFEKNYWHFLCQSYDPSAP